jgi:hypothetical protein
VIPSRALNSQRLNSRSSEQPASRLGPIRFIHAKAPSQREDDASMFARDRARIGSLLAMLCLLVYSEYVRPRVVVERMWEYERMEASGLTERK